MRSLKLRQKALLSIFGLAAGIALAAGCGGSSGGSSTPTPTPTPCTPFTGTLSNVQTKVFTPTCALTSCHAGSNPAGPGLDLSDTTHILATASNVTAQETFNGGSIKILVPGSSGISYLYLKITDATGIAQLPMPQTGQLLDSCSIQAVKDWIDAGMPQN